MRQLCPDATGGRVSLSGAKVTEGPWDGNDVHVAAGGGSPVGADKLETSISVEVDTTKALGV